MPPTVATPWSFAARPMRPNRSLKGDPHRQASVGRETVHVIIGLAAHTAFPAVAP